MGRKPIPPSQRAQPISFSLKPHLIEKIDDYAADLRFNRSKFLMEAVTQYILKADMGYMASSNNINDMTLAQKVAVGLAALQEANREGQTISKPVMDNLRNELDVKVTVTPKKGKRMTKKLKAQMIYLLEMAESGAGAYMSDDVEEGRLDAFFDSGPVIAEMFNRLGI